MPVSATSSSAYDADSDSIPHIAGYEAFANSFFKIRELDTDTGDCERDLVVFRGGGAPDLAIINAACFRYWMEQGVLTSFRGKNSELSLLFARSERLPFRVVVSRGIFGLAAKRYGREGVLFAQPKAEVFLSLDRASRLWSGSKRHDGHFALLLNGSSTLRLFDPDAEVDGNRPLAELDGKEMVGPQCRDWFFSVQEEALRGFKALQKAWPQLMTFEFDFGLLKGKPVINGIIHPGSYGVMEDNAYEKLGWPDAAQGADAVKCRLMAHTLGLIGLL